MNPANLAEGGMKRIRLKLNKNGETAEARCSKEDGGGGVR